MKTINISNLKTHASATLKEVKAGETYIILDRDNPVARLIPIDHTSKIDTIPAKHSLSFSKLSFNLDIDVSKKIREDRDERY